MRQLAIAICALTLLCGTGLTTSTAFAAGDKTEARDGKRACAEKLGLTDEQCEQMKAARQEAKAAHKNADSKEAHMAAHEAFIAKVQGILNAEQFTEWKQHHDKRRAERRANRGDGEGKREGKGKRGGDA